ncbi:sugar ABC transporter ATP-binding protein [Oceanirhabdus sp. W0125-5]|uniref:sugar ABC transporter ATP-binding protein n=1 Tax=Oceanirhabdus sp. W0125-5 TaxID=2999116 RepID=UPI0022F333E6|nr:sugar ABC transporter ATP-binding protein [Oceanirhabdus sp. W0125-5]WBW98428.1 sugar ABC transporter ATP-binding protein [Oceanirhabdus sp. W0125-5]
MSKFVLQMDNISKFYGENQVLKDITLKIKPGEIHALIGENGAGKSTLMNILFGMPVINSTGGFKGKILLDGEEVNISSPMKAMDYGIGMVHQEFMLIPGFTVTENIKLNRERTKDNPISKLLGPKLKTLDTKRMKEESQKALNKLGMDIDCYSKIAGLPVGHMQFVEIAREIDKDNIKLLVFDEPTAVLTETEADILLKAMKKIAKSGIAIIFISHRLDEIKEIADTITILRDGSLVCSDVSTNFTTKDMAEKMVGRTLDISYSSNIRKEFKNSEVIMTIKDLKVDMPGESVKKVDLDIYKGEILGIGGLAGQGKIGIANGLMGLYHSSGNVTFNGEPFTLNSPLYSLKNKLAFVSEDRRGVGLLLEDSIENNIAISAMQINNKFLLDLKLFKLNNWRSIRRNALKYIKDLDIRCSSPTQFSGRLSGGNQQKVCVARALTLAPDLLLVSEPTRGIDIGAKRLVLNLLKDLNEKFGLTIIMTSSELAELRSISHRIAIISEGQVQGILHPDSDDYQFGLLMSGKSLDNLNQIDQKECEK